MDMKATMRARFWELRDELDALEPEIMALREEFNKAHGEYEARYEAEVRPLAKRFQDREKETDFWAKRQELADISRFLRDPVTGIAKMGPRPTRQ